MYVLYIGTWNVHSLVETSRDPRVCCSRRVAYGDTGVERKLDILVKELARYHISIVGIQEIKWFGSDIWPSGEWPANDDIAIRREGVGILLDGRATAVWRAVGEMWTAVSSWRAVGEMWTAVSSWRAVGEMWTAVSSCIMTARLKLALAGQ